MFNKKDDRVKLDMQPPATPAKQAPSTPSAASEASVLVAGIKMFGNLECDGDIVIAGSVEGDIASRGLTVEEGATIKGSITVETATILGSVEGQVHARTVHISHSGRMMGEVEYESLSIDKGAEIDGQFHKAKPSSASSKVSKITAAEGSGRKPMPKPSAIEPETI